MEGSRKVGAALVVCALLTMYGCGGAAGEFKAAGATETPEVPSCSIFGINCTPTLPPSAQTPTATIPPMAPSSIHFEDASPPNIGVRQSGLEEQSTLTFV